MASSVVKRDDKKIYKSWYLSVMQYQVLLENETIKIWIKSKLNKYVYQNLHENTYF
jgi:hypothetical protein